MKKHLLILFSLLKTFNIISQILLNPLAGSPYNVSTMPSFSWTISGNISECEYLECIVAPLINQSPTLSIQNPLFINSELPCTQTFLSSINTSLNTCTDYVWQIKSYKFITEEIEGNQVQTKQYLASSTIEQFKTLGCTNNVSNNIISSNPLYIEPSLKLDHFVYYVDESTLNFKYEEKYDNDKITLRISNGDDIKEILITNSIYTPLHNGSNYLQMSFDSIFEDFAEVIGAIYTVEIIGPKGDKQYFKFKKI